MASTRTPKATARRRGGARTAGRRRAWLAAHLDDPDLRLVHVSPDRRVYNKRHVAGATYSDLHKELALQGHRARDRRRASASGWSRPREETEARAAPLACRRGRPDRLLRRHRDEPPGDPRLLAPPAVRLPADRLHILDGGIEAWRRAGGETTTELPEADLADGLRKPVDARRARRRPDRDLRRGPRLEPRGTSQAGDGPTRILDVRTAAEWVGTDLRAKRGGHIPGARQRCFVDLLTDEGTFRPVDEMVSLVRASGADPSEIRATYCQGGVRAALVWFVLHELAGFDGSAATRVVGGVGEPAGQPDRDALEPSGGLAGACALATRASSGIGTGGTP